MFTHYEQFNDMIRFLIDRFIGLCAIAFRVNLFLQMKTYYLRQAVLRVKFKITDSTSVHGYDESTRASVEACYGKSTRAVYSYTSGSTKEPKKIVYDSWRLLNTRLVFVSAFFQYLAQLPFNRTLFLFSPITPDNSLTTLLLQETGLPPYVSGLQAPHRVQNDPDIRLAAQKYGETAVRLWILAISNPAMIYATNPSTIATFLHDLHQKWETSRELIVDYMNTKQELRQNLQRIHKRIASRGAYARLKRIAESSRPLPISELFPGLRGFSCWDGGYVGPFLDQIRTCLPKPQYSHWPMYSMSTETIETIAGLRKGQPYFVPLAPGVYYEFIEEGKSDVHFHLLGPRDLVPGKLYSMVVSDAYGLQRYQTEDLFECIGFVSGIPDLRFARRRNLSYSFTGEKLTAEQLKFAYQDVVLLYPELSSSSFLTCFPSKPCGELIPHYRLIFVEMNGKCSMNLPAITSHVEQKLREFNPEFRSKINSGRLGRMEFESISVQEFVHRVAGHAETSVFGSQFKFLPLYPKLWEALHESPNSRS
ncbi:GH3 auxin-responsive promoter family protein [bacterium]|nr:GH3 auxin-responsive promoter family protein [bacterium]